MKKNYLYGLIAIIAVTNIGFYYGLILPQKIKADNIFKEIEAKRSERLSVKSPATFAEARADIAKFREMLSNKADMTKIIRELNSLARGASLAIHDISYQSKKAGEEGISPVSFSFPVEGRYSNIKNFIYKLESSKRLITIDDMSLEKASGKEDIRLKIKVSVYLKS